MRAIDSGCARYIEILQVGAGPAWPRDMVWPAGEHTIPIRSLPQKRVAVDHDTAVSAMIASTGEAFALVGRHNGGFTPTFDAVAWLDDMKHELYRPEHVQ